MAARTLPLAATLQQRVREWALRRQGRDLLPLRLAARRVYIVPTPAGWTFAMVVGVMFIAGINYGNGLALLFTFWLAGFAVVGMVQTQRGLAGTLLREASVEPGFAGEAVRLQLAVSGRSALGDLHLSVDGTAPVQSARGDDISRDGELALAIPVHRRGRWRAPPIRLSSTAPFGLFRTWTWLTLDATTIVYPRPAGALPVPETAGDETGGTGHTQGHDEFAWLRDFREGDSPRQVAWKAYARGAPLLVREYHGAASPTHEFDFDALAGLDVEARLSQLTRWIVDAAARGEEWVLRMPDAAPLAGGGPEHLDLCLARLALHGLRRDEA